VIICKRGRACDRGGDDQNEKAVHEVSS